MEDSDWSSGIRYHNFSTRHTLSSTGFKLHRPTWVFFMMATERTPFAVFTVSRPMW